MFYVCCSCCGTIITMLFNLFNFSNHHVLFLRSCKSNCWFSLLLRNEITLICLFSNLVLLLWHFCLLILLSIPNRGVENPTCCQNKLTRVPVQRRPPAVRTQHGVLDPPNPPWDSSEHSTQDMYEMQAGAESRTRGFQKIGAKQGFAVAGFQQNAPPKATKNITIPDNLLDGEQRRAECDGSKPTVTSERSSIRWLREVQASEGESENDVDKSKSIPYNASSTPRRGELNSLSMNMFRPPPSSPNYPPAQLRKGNCASRINRLVPVCDASGGKNVSRRYMAYHKIQAFKKELIRHNVLEE